jgi:beta-N-acetylhexosaminidase
MRSLGATNKAALARQAGRAMGRELAAAGFNVNFAPVLDVDSNPANPVIGDRAFARTPGRVARLGLAFAEGLMDAGILPCGKHFPGHGDTSEDSHLALPEVARSLKALQRVELLPFRRAIAAGLPMLMSAHVRYPALDPDLPATLSYKILTKLLRHQMGFRGVVVSDDLAMHALDGYGPIAELAPRALAAGCDLLLACQSLEDGEAAVAGIQRALDDGRLSERRVSEALRRVSKLHRWLERQPPQTETLDEVLSSGEGAGVVRAIEDRLASRTA